METNVGMEKIVVEASPFFGSISDAFNDENPIGKRIEYAVEDIGDYKIMKGFNVVEEF
jgi:hypothetical protein